MNRDARRLLAVLAHPDDESLGFGGTLAKYAAGGVEVSLVTATRGDAGRFHGHRPGSAEHPGPVALAAIREAELRAAAAILGVREVTVLDYRDQQLDQVAPRAAIANIAGHLRRIRPDVVVTFGPDGVERQATPWPDWAITTTIDTRAVAARVWQAVSCHASQVTAYKGLLALPPEQHEALWGSQCFYRAFSTVNAGRERETDLFEGIR